jgi:membrane peptidoglycan carboxypeptidase
MLATIANGGIYHQAHMVAYVVNTTTGSKTTPKVTVSQALTSDQDSQVQWGMSTVTSAAAGGTAAGEVSYSHEPVIAKTGTTSSNRTAYFIGAVPQAALTVGIWTANQGDVNNPQTLANLGGTVSGGFGGYWPARIWNTFAESQWSTLQTQSFLNPVFTGAKWIQWKAPAKPKAKPKPTPTPTATCKNNFFGCRGRGHGPGGTPTTPVTQQPTTSPTGACLPGFCSTPTATPTGNNPTATAPTAGTNATGATTTAQSGFAIGGVLSVVPGSLLWTRAARRRRRRRREKPGPD